MYKWVVATVIVFAIIASASNASVGHALSAFIILGIIPGTDLTLPIWAYLLFVPAGLFTLVYWLSHQTLLIGETTPPPKPHLNKDRMNRIAKAKTASKKTRSNSDASAKKVQRKKALA